MLTISRFKDVQGQFNAVSMQYQPMTVLLCSVQSLCKIYGVHYWHNELIICKWLPGCLVMPTCEIGQVCLSVADLAGLHNF